MTINTKFNVGDTVWFIQKVRQLTPTSYMCPVCNGTGSMKLFGKKCDANIMRNQYICKDGYFHSVEYTPQVCSSKIKAINCYADKDSALNLTYYVEDCGAWCASFDEFSLFSNKEEASVAYNKTYLTKGVESNNHDVT